MKKDFNVVISGAGPSGLSAATFAASEGLSTIVLEAGQMGGRTRTSSMIENFLGHENGISGKALMDRAIKQAKRFGVQVNEQCRVDSIRRDGRHLLVSGDGGCEYVAKAVVLATGLGFRPLPAHNAEELTGRGVSYLPSLARQKAMKACGRAVVIGGGNSAGQCAYFLSTIVKEVCIIIRGESLHSSMSAYLIDKIASRPNISICANRQVIAVEGTNCVEAIHLICPDGQEELPCNEVCIFIGSEPKTAWLPQAIQRTETGYIIADSHCMSTMKGVFVAGDVKAGNIERVAVAVGDGAAVVGNLFPYFKSLDK